jgi:hypothetical protein
VYVFANQKFVAPEQSANLGQMGFNIHWALSAQRKKSTMHFNTKAARLSAQGQVLGANSQVEGFVFQDIL